MTCGWPEQLGSADAGESQLPASTLVDPRWTGIVEVLVSGLDGVVRWEADSVVLRLRDDHMQRRAGDVAARTLRVADLDGLRLCLGRVGVKVVFDPAGVTFPDASIADFLRKLVESGLMADVTRSAA